MSCWYRPGKKVDTNQQSNHHEDDSLMPILFFHGIAPAGIVGYLPIVLYGLATESERPVFLFENISISCVLDFQPLTEKQTVDGVMECLKRFGANQQNLSLVGHSFGSCPIAWLLASKKLDQQIKQVVLLDPVAVVLSEPDVMVSFLYSEGIDKIRIVASSEIMTQSYLRRHFAWYNSELYVEDVKCPMLVFCSEHDEIVNSENVKHEMQRHHQKGHQYHCWEGVGHGACVVNPNKWTEIKRQMLEQELQLLRTR
jgi:pimeloyl-ACP methyl ester carboxylesterase